MGKTTSSRLPRSRTLQISYWVLAFLPLLVTCVAFSRMPDTVAVHFGISGTPDRWADRWEIFLLPIAIIILSCIIQYLVRLSAGDSAQPARNRTVSLMMFVAALVILNIVTVWVIVINIPELQGQTTWIDFLKLVYICLGISLVFFGWLIPKLSKNPLQGARVPWELSDAMWSRLQHFAQRLLIVGGIIELVICGILLPRQVATISTLVILMAIVISTLLYGYRLKNRDERY